MNFRFKSFEVCRDQIIIYFDSPEDTIQAMEQIIEYLGESARLNTLNIGNSWIAARTDDIDGIAFIADFTGENKLRLL